MYVIDSHIHFDLYDEPQIETIIQELATQKTTALITVSNHYESAKKNLALARRDHRIKSAFGYHPEQELPTQEKVNQLIDFIRKHQSEMIAIGEVGLPYYTRQENPTMDIKPYIELLDTFIRLAAELNKPIVLHAVYDDAPIVLDLLDKHKIKKAHFHWFKGDEVSIERLIGNNYVISITPDVLYEKEIQTIVQQVPLTHLLVETDGPWPFEGPFQGKTTHPGMMHETMKVIAELKGVELKDTYKQIYENTVSFYELQL